MSDRSAIGASSPEGVALIAGVAIVYLAVRLLPRWIAAGSARWSPRDLHRRLAGGTPPLLLDVRAAIEVAETGTIPGSINVPMSRLSTWLSAGAEALDKRRPVVTLCRSDTRAAFAARRLRREGFRSTALLVGGIEAWAQEGLPLHHPKDRHIGS
ncbi:MAG: rhodanese-like domain-containing protein [Chromatiales bacterium]|jgi:rhodanese-related sulfurtransferase